MRFAVLLLAAAVVLAFSLTGDFYSQADDSPAENSQTVEADVNPAALSRQLDHQQLSVREEASRALESLGVGAVEALSRVAERGSPEARRRAFEILEKFRQADEAALRDAAGKALEKIAAGNNAEAAEKASQLLSPEASSADDARYPSLQRLPLRDENLLPPHLRLPAELFEGVGATLRTTTRVNGRVETTVKEDGRTVKIVEEPNSGITIEVTEPNQAGEEAAEAKKYTARDVAKLKENHPEAHRLYEQYMNPPQPQGNIPRGRFPQGLFPPEQRGGVPLPDFPDFDDDFFRQFERMLPPDLREGQPARPGAPAGDLREIHRQLQEQLRQMREDMRELRDRRDGHQPEAAPENRDDPPSREKPAPKPAIDKKKTIEV